MYAAYTRVIDSQIFSAALNQYTYDEQLSMYYVILKGSVSCGSLKVAEDDVCLIDITGKPLEIMTSSKHI